MKKNMNQIVAIVALMEAMGLRVVSITKDHIASAKLAAETAEAAEKIRRAARHSDKTIEKAEAEAECDLSALRRDIAIMAKAPVLMTGIREANNLAATPAAKLSVAHRGNRRNGGKKHYFPLVALPVERGIIDGGEVVLGLEHGWVLRGTQLDYDPELSASLAAMNNRQARIAAYEEVAEIVQDYKDAIASKRAARRAIYTVKQEAINEAKAAKAAKAAAEEKARKLRLALRAANRAEEKAWNVVDAEEARKRQAAVLRKYIAAKEIVAAAAAKQQAAWEIVAKIDDIAKDVGDHILAAYMNAEHEGLAFWIHERGSSPTAADVISAFAGKIAA